MQLPVILLAMTILIHNTRMLHGFLTTTRRNVNVHSSSIISHSVGRRHAPRSPCRRLATLSLSSLSSVEAEQLLMDPIRKAYAERETDGILELAATKTISIEHVQPADLVQASLQAFEQDSNAKSDARKNKGKVAGVLNAWIGSCRLHENVPFAADYALQLLEAYDALSENADESNENGSGNDNAAPQPDMVTFCLVYACVYRHDPQKAASILERAARSSKKTAGSQRRKAMAAARRKPVAHRLLNYSEENGSDDEATNASSALLDELQRLIPNLDVLAETDDYVVFQNPSGVACYHKHTTTAGKIKGQRRPKRGDASQQQQQQRQQDIALEDALLHINLPLSTLNAECRGLVHRLDRGTSGCMIWAKSDHMHALLVTEFFLRRVQKTYTTLVVLDPAVTDNEDSSESNRLADEGRVSLPVDGRPAESTYRVLERYGTEAALVQVQTMTGRKHQVRVHCAQGLSSPVVRDTLYGDSATVCPAWSVDDDDDGDEEQPERFLLHASSLSIPALHLHTTEAPLPSWWTPILDNVQKVCSK
jgi:23S rRNA-/tRNA-specific pseudouridylate synthase